TPRRSVIGFDSGRLAMILAVLEARCGLNFAGMDVYLSVAGGYRINEPAGDLAAAAALLSSLSGNPVPARSVFFGEIALSGAVRAAPRMDQRLKEAARLGFQRAYGPDSSAAADGGLTVSPIARLIDLVDLLAPDAANA
ncbi:MAG: DNA repair protein RadA, partial [Hyphomonas sp.]|nr:DNA repair protein RadA [Hyphomonas sp.]